MINHNRVRITHIPTGISVACDAHRQQHRNMASARQALRSKLWALKNLQLVTGIVASYELPDGDQYPVELDQHKEKNV